MAIHRCHYFGSRGVGHSRSGVFHVARPSGPKRLGRGPRGDAFHWANCHRDVVLPGLRHHRVMAVVQEAKEQCTRGCLISRASQRRESVSFVVGPRWPGGAALTVSREERDA